MVFICDHASRKWEKGRGTVLVFDPKIGPLDSIYVNFQNSWMLSGTLDRGMEFEILARSFCLHHVSYASSSYNRCSNGDKVRPVNR